MKDEIDFSDYPNLHLGLMIDDYDELLEQARQQERRDDEIVVKNTEVPYLQEFSAA